MLREDLEVDTSNSSTLTEIHRTTVKNETVELTRSWLRTFATVDESFSNINGQGMVKANASVRVWEEALRTNIQLVEQGMRPVGNVSLPTKIENVTEWITGLQYHAFVRRPPPTPTSMASSENVMTPSKIRAYYDITTNGSSATKHAVVETDGFASTRDVEAFAETFGIDLPPLSLVDSSIRSKNNQEASLDVQVMVSVASGVPLIEVEGSDGPAEDFLEYVHGQADDLADVYSISYGEEESLFDETFLLVFDRKMKYLAQIGTTVVASSGDDGANGPLARGGVANCTTRPQFPASSPHVVAVGATQGPEVGDPEIACSSVTGGLITSGGGFSGVFAAPPWQQLGPNVTSRGYPDVAFAGAAYEIISQGVPIVAYGTSASAPLFAAMLSLVNSERRASGRRPATNVVKRLYEAPSTLFTDVVVGNNYCAMGQPNTAVCCPAGYDAGVGWDAVTGRGSVSLPNLRIILLND